ncbi:pyridoxamine 5'-phosphate oxidase family protein [Streptomyces sp. NPDC004830]
MHAHLGDRLIVESPTTGVVRRDGEIIGLHHDDGTPPYDVRWSDTGDVTLVFPGPDAHLQQGANAQDTAAGETGGAAASSDLGRRLARARKRSGLALEEAARRARMSPQYLDYLETHASDPGLGTLLRLADALGTTLLELQGGDQDRPPGQGQALLHPHMRHLDERECRTLLSTHGVGRISLTTADGPAVLPVNYDVVDDAVVFRTAPGTAPAGAVGRHVAFEVDHVDDAMSQGWSVLLTGRARAVGDPDEIHRLDELAHTPPWAGGGRTLWVAIAIDRLSGRRIAPADET